MRIRAVDLCRVPVNRRGGWIFLRLHTADGRVGLGEASHSGDDASLVGLLTTRAAPLLVGADSEDSGALHERLVRALRPAAGHLPSQTICSAVELALWDLAGQRAQVPVWMLLGGTPNGRVPLYANINRASADRSPEGIADVARSAARAGFQAVKCAPFDELSPDAELEQACVAIELGVRRVAAVRAAIGPDAELMVDCQGRCGRWSNEAATRVAEFGVRWLEEPVSSADVAALRQIAAVAPQRIAVGEHLYGQPAYEPFLGWPRPPILMPDVKHAGGIAECLKIAALASRHGNPVSLHNPSGPVSMAASLHVMALRSECLALEFAWREVSWRATLVDPPERLLEDGSLKVPDLPGLGVRLQQPKGGPPLQRVWSSN